MTPILENQMEKKSEHNIETGGFSGQTQGSGSYLPLVSKERRNGA